MTMKKLLLLPILLSVFIVTPAFADEPAQDYVVTIDSNTTLPYVFCQNNDTIKCSDYTYVIFEPSGFQSVSYFSLQLQSNTIRLPNNAKSMISLSTITQPAGSARFTTGQTFTGSIKVTLTNSIDSPCPEPEPCDCPIDCDEPFIVQLFKSGFWGVATGIVTIIVPVLALFLVFRLIHDFLWGRG